MQLQCLSFHSAFYSFGRRRHLLNRLFLPFCHLSTKAFLLMQDLLSCFCQVFKKPLFVLLDCYSMPFFLLRRVISIIICLLHSQSGGYFSCLADFHFLYWAASIILPYRLQEDFLILLVDPYPKNHDSSKDYRPDKAHHTHVAYHFQNFLCNSIHSAKYKLHTLPYYLDESAPYKTQYYSFLLAILHSHFVFLAESHLCRSFHQPMYTPHNLMRVHSQTIPYRNPHFHIVKFPLHVSVHFQNSQNISHHQFFDVNQIHLVILPTISLHNALQIVVAYSLQGISQTRKNAHFHVFSLQRNLQYIGCRSDKFISLSHFFNFSHILLNTLFLLEKHQFQRLGVSYFQQVQKRFCLRFLLVQDRDVQGGLEVQKLVEEITGNQRRNLQALLVSLAKYSELSVASILLGHEEFQSLADAIVSSVNGFHAYRKARTMETHCFPLLAQQNQLNRQIKYQKLKIEEAKQ